MTPTTPCPIEHDLETVDVSKVVKECHQCSLDVCLAQVEACVQRARFELLNRTAERRLQQWSEP